MFKDTKAFSGFAVDDLQKAKTFYSETLGLRMSDLDPENGLMALHIAGSRDILVYLSPSHTPASFTILNFPVEDVEGTVDALAAILRVSKSLLVQIKDDGDRATMPEHLFTGERLLQGPRRADVTGPSPRRRR